jgi:hypothetical protein
MIHAVGGVPNGSVAGVREKVLAAYRAGITTVILPADNQAQVCVSQSGPCKTLRMLAADSQERMSRSPSSAVPLFKLLLGCVCPCAAVPLCRCAPVPLYRCAPVPLCRCAPVPLCRCCPCAPVPLWPLCRCGPCAPVPLWPLCFPQVEGLAPEVSASLWFVFVDRVEQALQALFPDRVVVAGTSAAPTPAPAVAPHDGPRGGDDGDRASLRGRPGSLAAAGGGAWSGSDGAAWGGTGARVGASGGEECGGGGEGRSLGVLPQSSLHSATVRALRAKL